MARMPNRADVEAAVDAAVELGRAQAKALTALPGAITAIAEAARNINATANEARAVIRKAQAVTDRLDSMLDHVEPAVSEITPTLQALREAQQRIVAMTGSTEKMASFVEDAGAGLTKLAGLSGASGLFSRIAAATKPAEPSAASARSLAAVRAELIAADEPAEEILAELVEPPVSPVGVEEGIEEGIEDADLAEPQTSVPADAESTTTDAPIFDAVAEVVPVDLPATSPEVSNGEARADQTGEDEAGGEQTAEAHQVTEAEVDAALDPVELGSEADGPDEDPRPS